MKKIIIFLSSILIASNSFCQNIEDELYKLLQQDKCLQVVNKVCSIREKEYFKNAFMDYCLAYGYCKLNEPSLSVEWFDHLLNSYNNLSDEKRTQLQELKASCIGTTTTSNPTTKLFEFLHGMSADGFEGNKGGVESKMGIPSLEDTVKELDFEHLTFDTQKRKFTLQQKKEAIDYYKVLTANQSFKVDTTAHFVVFHSGGAMSIKDHTKVLEEYYTYYTKAFNLGESNRLITIFYCTNRNDFNEAAQKVHQIPVPKSTFGYASSIDLVMMGIANIAWLGAMKHELFHLMIRSYVGDIPPWLDEGAACFFESSSLYKDHATTNFSWSNYRTGLLHNIDEVKYQLQVNHKQPLVIPSVQQLINYNWQQFSGVTGDLMMKSSFHQSLSYSFVTYLNEKHLLEKAIEAYRNRSYTEPPAVAATDKPIILHLRTNDELLESITGMKPEQVQEDFKIWCKSKNIDLW